jgi:putative hemolysin
MDRLGRLPKAGDRVQIPGYVLTVLSMDRLRIARIRVTPVAPT